jgi:hypothetical protein
MDFPYYACMRAFAALLVLVVLAMASAFTATPTLAQQPPKHERAGWQKGAAKPPPGRMAEPVRGDPRRPERMSPEDRERLRRDIDDANRRMERPARR